MKLHDRIFLITEENLICEVRRINGQRFTQRWKLILFRGALA